MTTTYMLDTNTFSYIASGKSQAARVEFRRRAGDPNAQLCISVMTEAEVRYGMKRRALSAARRDAIEDLLASFATLPWGLDAAAVYAAALPELHTRGIGVSLMDFLIAAHAAASGSVLVTHDKTFSRIAGIAGMSTTVDWANDL